MTAILFVTIGLVLLGLCAGYIRICENLMVDDEPTDFDPGESDPGRRLMR